MFTDKKMTAEMALTALKPRKKNYPPWKVLARIIEETLRHLATELGIKADSFLIRAGYHYRA